MAEFEDIIALCEKDNQQKEWTIVFDSVTLTNSDLVADSVEFTESILSGNVIEFGILERSQFNFKFYPPTSFNYFEGSVFSSTITIASHTIAIGEFVVETATPDVNGIVDIVAYSKKILEDIEVDASVFCGEENTLNIPGHITIGNIVCRIYEDLGIYYFPQGFEDVFFFEEDGTYVDVFANRPGEGGGTEIVRLRFFKTVCTIQNGSYAWEWSNFFIRKIRGTWTRDLIRGLIGNEELDVLKTEVLIAGTGTVKHDLLRDLVIPKPTGHLYKVSLYDRVQITDSTGTLQTNLYSDLRLHGTSSSTMPIQNETVFGAWEMEYSAGKTLIGKKCTEIIKAISELSGNIPYANRSGGISYFNTSKPELFPLETLYPNEILYPKGSVVLYDLNRQYLDSLYFNSSNQYYYRRLYTGLLVDDPVVTYYNYVINVDGLFDLDLTTNLLLETFNMGTYSEPSSFLNILVDRIKNITTSSFSLRAIGLPNVQVGSKINIIAPNGEVFETFIMQRQLKGIQHLEDTLNNNITGGV